ncbi:PAC2 family protein [Candidatus Woesearchaeota archaeon]|nr:PAC2 family protein [Candidatus Woesearchaeota archaeon]
MDWQIDEITKVKLKNPILIEGLPGIGNVGKIAIDFMIDSLKAKKIYEITSYNFPHCVFVNENNIVELPAIEVFHKNIKGKDYLFLAGDVQPLDERSCYEFCDNVLDLFQKYHGKEIITLGGIALDKIPKKPRIYFTGTNSKILRRYQSRVVQNIYGVTGPIIGVSGLLTGLARKRKLDAISILAETYGHPTYLGVRSAKEILRLLNHKLNFKLDLNALDREVKEIENEINKGQGPKIQRINLPKPRKDNTNYIG